MCFDFNNNIKNKFTNRRTPISEQLIKIGFMDYVKYQKKYEEEMLFDKVKFYSDNNINFTNKFSLYNRKYITKEREKTFYSFKHLVNQSLKNTKTPIYTINDIVGHSDGKGNKDIEDYGAESQPISILKKAIEESINYDYLNFSHITSTIKKVYK